MGCCWACQKDGYFSECWSLTWSRGSKCKHLTISISLSITMYAIPHFLLLYFLSLFKSCLCWKDIMKVYSDKKCCPIQSQFFFNFRQPTTVHIRSFWGPIMVVTLRCDSIFSLTYSVLQSHNNLPNCFGCFGKWQKNQSRHIIWCFGFDCSEVSAQEINECIISNYLAWS